VTPWLVTGYCFPKDLVFHRKTVKVEFGIFFWGGEVVVLE